MVKRDATVAAFVILLATLPAAIVAQDAKAVLSNAAKAMGADNLRTIQYSGSGLNFAFGQSVNPNAPWPRFTLKTYTRDVDFNAGASRVQLVRTGAEKRGGGFVGITVDQPQEQFIASTAPWAQQVNIAVTPYGFLKSAMAATGATVKAQTVGGKHYNVVTYTAENKYKVNGYINDQNMVEKVETWLDNPVLGDLLYESTYTNYKDFGGVKFPTRMVQQQGGFPILDLTVTDVKPNAAVNVQPPQGARGGGGGGAAEPAVQTDKTADGVFHLKGQENSVAVEFKDYVVVVEGPVSEARSLAVITETKKLIPNKPIKYLVNTHHHFDHIGGLRTYVDEGATIVTHQTNKAFYEKIFAMPHTLNPDKLWQSKKKATIEAVSDKKTLTDGTRTMELYSQRGNPHTDGVIVAYLPKEKILIEADAYNPPPPNFPVDALFASNLVENIERLKLNIDRILPIHGPAITKADLYKAAGRPTSTN